MPDLRISEDTILLTARLVGEAEDMKEAANQALKDAWSDHREALKALGLTGKEISAEVAQFKAAITESRLTSVEVDKREQKAEGKEEYLAILTSPRARAREAKKSTTQNASNSAAFEAKRAKKSTAPSDQVEAIRNDPSMHIVSASEIKPKSEPQPSPEAGSDLTNSQALNGQVATHSPETADEIHERASTDDEASPEAGPQAEASPSREQVAGTLADREARHEGQGAPASLPTPKYAAPGIVTYENHPPEGVERSAISIAFGNMGQDGALIQDDLANGRAQPIVKQGKVILDGWARYMTARTMTELDGSPLTYAVVQYDGTDPLIDVIRWNVEGRMLNEQQKRVIAQTLTRQNPKRKDDIYRAFELWMEPV